MHQWDENKMSADQTTIMEQEIVFLRERVTTLETQKNELSITVCKLEGMVEAYQSILKGVMIDYAEPCTKALPDDIL